MIATTLAQVAAATGATLAGGTDSGATVTGPTVFDTRAVQPGGLFVAFGGENVDGHDYVDAAMHAGAVAAIVTRPVDAPHLLVEDAAIAMGDLARWYAREMLHEVTVVGITGSSGKTSTKDLAAYLLESLGPTVAPPGSFNNELGLPYTVLLADADTRYLVLEESARGIGHIRYLTGIAPPRIGAVLNVGTAHLGEFGSRAAIAVAKGELVEALPSATDGGVAILNVDDPLVRAMAGRTAARVVGVGESAAADVRAENVSLDGHGRAAFTLVTSAGSASVTLGLVGAHHVGNALAAAAIALECGLGLADVANRLAEATPRSRGRMEVHERADGVTVINDAYNANPESVRAALKTLAGLRGGGRRVWAVLGGMNELGAASLDEHDAIGRLAVRLSIDRVVAVGDTAQALYLGASHEGSWDGEAVWDPDRDAALTRLRAELAPGDVVLVKASRSHELDRLANALVDDVPAATAGGPAS